MGKTGPSELLSLVHITISHQRFPDQTAEVRHSDNTKWLLCINMLISSASGINNVFMVGASIKEVMMGKELVNNALLHQNTM